MARFRETTRYTVEEIRAKAQEDARYTLPALAVRPTPSSSSGSPGCPRIQWLSASSVGTSEHRGILHRRNIDRSDKRADLETFGFVVNAPPRLNRHGEDLHRLFRHAQNSESRSFHKGGTKLRRDDSLAVVERSGQLTNWTGVDIGVAGAAGTVWNTEARHVEALW